MAHRSDLVLATREYRFRPRAPSRRVRFGVKIKAAPKNASPNAVTEIRPIQPTEAEDFLSLLCRCFELDPARARSVFYTEPYFEISRKWALFDEKEIVSILTTTPLEFGWGKVMGIAGVATKPELRNQGLAQRLLRHVLEQGQTIGETGALLFAHKTVAYEKVGFTVIDEVVRGKLATRSGLRPLRRLDSKTVRELYDSWSRESEARLRRDDRRWKFWNWMNRSCEAFEGGYLCFEPNLCREAVLKRPSSSLPVLPDTDWLGLASMTEMLGLKLLSQRSEMLLMGRAIPMQPQMFMTDQF